MVSGDKLAGVNRAIPGAGIRVGCHTWPSVNLVYFVAAARNFCQVHNLRQKNQNCAEIDECMESMHFITHATGINHYGSLKSP